MSDLRDDLYNSLSRRLAEERVARDEAWAEYWRRRRVVVIPDGAPNSPTVGVWANHGQAVTLLEKALSQKSWPAVIPLVRAALKALRGGGE